MHFKVKPWDFLNKKIVLPLQGITVFLCHDPCLMRIFKDLLVEERDFDSLWGEDIPLENLTQRIETVGLFGREKDAWVWNVDKASKEFKNYFATLSEESVNISLVLAFQKQDPIIKKIKKSYSEALNIIEIQAPQFYENERLLGFLASHTSVTLTREVQEYILNSVEGEVFEYLRVLDVVKLYSIERYDEIKTHFKGQKLDNFKLANYFSRKQFLNFYRELVLCSDDYNSLRSFFSFIQGHIIKLMDCSYANEKSRPSKYDRDIISCSSRWEQSELSRQLNIFSKFEIKAKCRDNSLKQVLKYQYTKLKLSNLMGQA